MAYILDKHKDSICGIIALPAFQSFRRMLIYNLSFLGLRVFLYMGIRFVLCKALDAISPFFHFKKYYSVQMVAQKYKIPFSVLQDVNSQEAQEIVNKYCPDIIFSITSPQKFQREILNFPRYGCFNIHSSLLPKYRGCNALFWAILYGEKKVGVTVHKMDEDLDTGSIALQKSFDVNSYDTVFSLYEKGVMNGATLANEFLSLIKKTDGNILLKNIPDAKNEKYYSFPQAKDRKMLYARGKSFCKYL